MEEGERRAATANSILLAVRENENLRKHLSARVHFQGKEDVLDTLNDAYGKLWWKSLALWLLLGACSSVRPVDQTAENRRPPNYQQPPQQAPQLSSYSEPVYQLEVDLEPPHQHPKDAGAPAKKKDAGTRPAAPAGGPR